MKRSILLFFMTACALSDEQAAEELSSIVGQTFPERPSKMFDVSLIRSDAFLRPNFPPHRTTHDGRVGVGLKAPRGAPNKVGFHLFSPEKMSQRFLESEAGARITTSTFEMSANEFHDSSHAGTLAHKAVCDATSQFPEQGAATNPYPCGTGDDCYDFTVVTGLEWVDTSSRQHVELWGTPVTVRIQNPKTSSAAIADVTTQAPVKGPDFLFKDMLEPMITNDGRLLVMRVANSKFSWFNDRTGKNVTGDYNIVYSAYNESAPPCDVTRWTKFKPIAHAPYDEQSAMPARYGFAMQKFRDMEGATIPDEVNLPATYPWIDRMGRNLFFFAAGSNLYFLDPADGKVKTRYPANCIQGADCDRSPANVAQIDAFEATETETRGLSVMGLWTNGKMVMLDGVLNNTDYGLGIFDEAHRAITLYSTEGGKTVRVASGRGNGANGAPPGYALNTTFVDSPENLFNYSPELTPRTSRDVVWLIASSKVADEVVFDDYVNPNSFILADMQVALTTRTPYSWKMQDGFTTSSPAGFRNAVRLQNAATAKSARWAIPKSGLLEGAGRIEPVALGGIHGKGLWLRPTSKLKFVVPEQPQNPLASDWFAGIFVDPRFDDDNIEREILSFPDESGIAIVGLSSLILRGPNGDALATIAIPPTVRGEWFHVGVLVSGATVRVFWNGYELGGWSASALQMGAGAFYVGDSPYRPTRGIRGWVDDLRVFAEAPDDEVICNHARGTLAAIDVAAAGDWATRANAYPNIEHARLKARMVADGGAVADKYVCYTRYQSELDASARDLPPFATSIRKTMLMPEGPLAFASPRPSSSTNAFCTSCHRNGGLGGLSMEALELDPSTPMQDDLRRQPLQAPRLMFGHVSTQALAPLGPSTPLQAPTTGVKLDQWLSPP